MVRRQIRYEIHMEMIDLLNYRKISTEIDSIGLTCLNDETVFTNNCFVDDLQCFQVPKALKGSVRDLGYFVVAK